MNIVEYMSLKAKKLKPGILIYRDETRPAALYNHGKWQLIGKSQCCSANVTDHCTR